MSPHHFLSSDRKQIVIDGSVIQVRIDDYVVALDASGQDPELTYDEGTDEFTPLYRVRDIVFKCKGCGAVNEGDGGPGASPCRSLALRPPRSSD